MINKKHPSHFETAKKIYHDAVKNMTDDIRHLEEGGNSSLGNLTDHIIEDFVETHDYYPEEVMESFLTVLYKDGLDEVEKWAKERGFYNLYEAWYAYPATVVDWFETNDTKCLYKPNFRDANERRCQMLETYNEAINEYLGSDYDYVSEYYF